jgi:outer membrane protein assembly factor BamB
MIGTLRCLDRTTSKVVWEKDLGKEYWPFLAEKKYHEWKGTNFSPIVGDGVVLAVFHAGFPHPGRGCVAFDAETGKQKWIFEEGKDVRAAPGDTPVLATLGKDRCAILTANLDKTLLAVRLSDGQKVWESPIASMNFDSAPVPKDFTYSPRTGPEGFVRSGDALYGFVSTTADLANNTAKATFRLSCVDRKTGKALWNQEGFKSGASLITADDLLFVRSFQSLYLVEATTKGYVLKGKVEKMFEGKSDGGADGGWVIPVLSRGKLYIRTPSELICFKVSKD